MFEFMGQVKYVFHLGSLPAEDKDARQRSKLHRA